MKIPNDMEKVVKAFEAISLEVINKMTRQNIKVGRAYIKKHSYPSYDYSFIIGVTGDYKGVVTMSLKEETAFYLVSAIMGNQPIKKFGELAESALRELANMTVARAFTVAAGNGNIDITPPTFVRGNGISFAVENIQETYVTTLNTPAGDVEFNISLIHKIS